MTDFTQHSKIHQNLVTILTVRSEMRNLIFGTGYPAYAGVYPSSAAPTDVRIVDQVNDTPPPDSSYGYNCDIMYELKYDNSLFNNTFHYMIPSVILHSKVAIYCGGHEGGVTNASGIHKARIQSLLDAGFCVLAFSMLCSGPNTSVFDATAGGSATARHNVMFANWIGLDAAGIPKYQASINPPYIPVVAPFAPFFEQVIAGMNWVGAGQYAIIGFSGGGWLADLLSAMDDRIVESYAICGGYPEFMRNQSEDDWGDVEQNTNPGKPELYGQVKYLDIYIAGSTYGKKKTQYFNVNDHIFPGSKVQNNWYEQFIQVYSAESGGSYDTVIENEQNADHEITDWTWNGLMQKITGQQ